jgi:hypothetical protein
MASRLLDPSGREVALEGILDPSSAQFQLWLAQAKRDHGDMSGKELGKVEAAIGGTAKRSKTLFNPFTGEIRKVEF